MEKAITISLIITAIHVSMLHGMILDKIPTLFRKFPLQLHKPLFECLTCMGSIYTLIIYPILYGFDLNIILTMLEVIGINTIISGIISRLYD